MEVVCPSFVAWFPTASTHVAPSALVNPPVVARIISARPEPVAPTTHVVDASLDVSQVVVGRATISYGDVDAFEVGINAPVLRKGFHSTMVSCATMLVPISNMIVLNKFPFLKIPRRDKIHVCHEEFCFVIRELEMRQ